MSEDRTVIAKSFTDSFNIQTKRSEPILLQYDGQGAGKKFPLKNGVFIIGRKEGVEIQIDDASVSRAHCEITITDSAVLVKDLGSLNHTYVNDVEVQNPTTLNHGDILRVGNVKLRYFAHGTADEILFDRIYQLAVTDKMLNIFRKEYLLEQLESEFKNTQNTFIPLSLMFFDLDKFKSINDTHGHAAGDYVLIETVNVVKKSCRDTDIFGRYGGEELCLLAPNTDKEAAHALADQIRQNIANHKFYFQNTLIPVTVSIGVACFTGDNFEKSEELLHGADAKLYEAKQTGRNKVCS